MAVLAVAGTGACDDNGDDQSGVAAPPGLNVEAADFQFRPSTLTVSASGQVTVNLANTGQALHNISIPTIAPEFDIDVQPGQSVPVIFVPPAPGPLEFFCKYHREMGMTGTFQAG